MIIKVKYLFGYGGMAFWPFIFVIRKSDSVIRHERIHLEQQKELFLVWFMILYVYYYIQGRVNGYSHHWAYLQIPFEKEAYANQWHENYMEIRKRNAWKNYVG